MNIYFACSITGGRDDQSSYQIIVDTLHAGGHHVPTAHLSRPDVMSLEEIVDPVEVYTRDIEWIDRSHAMIAEVSTPSHGVGYEIGKNGRVYHFDCEWHYPFYFAGRGKAWL